MKRFAVLLSLFVGLLCLVLIAQPAEATNNVSFSFRSGGYGTYAVRAFTFQPSFALQTYTYAAYQPFALVPAQPVADVAEPVYAAPNTVQLFAAPGYGYGNFVAQAPAFSTFRVGSTSFASFNGFRGGFSAVPSFNRVSFRSNFGVNAVNIRTVERRGFFGLGSSVTNTTIRTVAPGVNVQTFSRVRLR